MKLYHILFLLTTCQLTSAKTLITTQAYNRPDFIEMQHKTFKKFVLDEYEYVVFNDAPDQHMANQITDTCNRLGIRCIRVPQEIHTRPYLKRHPSDPLHRPNSGMVNGGNTDAGGWSYYYMKNHPEARVVPVSTLWCYELFCPHNIESRPIDYSASIETRKEVYRKYGFNEKEMNFFLKRPDTFEICMDNHFLHYRAGSNYNNLSPEYHMKKTQLIHEFINDITQN